jgi:hypothetical protein
VCEREREGGDMRWVREEGRRERRDEIRIKREIRVTASRPITSLH